MFNTGHILRTLFIFRMEKVLVQMVHNKNFQPQVFFIFVSYIRVFTAMHPTMIASPDQILKYPAEAKAMHFLGTSL